jgi:hypothetical protein
MKLARALIYLAATLLFHRARSAAVRPLPSGCLTTPAYSTTRQP